MRNEQWLINANPKGRALTSEDFKRTQAETSALGDGQVLVRVELLSFDPSQKGQMENIGYHARNWDRRSH